MQCQTSYIYMGANAGYPQFEGEILRNVFCSKGLWGLKMWVSFLGRNLNYRGKIPW
jgi:hypothetical protein